MAPDFSQGLHLQMAQRQEMRMTPQMIQSMEMLQLPIMALEQRIKQELLENPALEMKSFQDDMASGEETYGEEETYTDDSADAVDANDDLRKVDEIDYEWDTYYDEISPLRRTGGGDEDESFDPVENAADRPATFAAYMEGQLAYFELNARERELCRRIILHLDNSGYLDIPLDAVSDGELDPPASEEELETALRVVQRMDPPGVGARDVGECLLLQMDALGENHALARTIVERHLEDLGNNRLPQIAKSLGVSLDDVKEAIAFIRTLKPQPAAEYADTGVQHARPDVVAEVELELDEDGRERERWEVNLAESVDVDISDLFMALHDTTKYSRELRRRMLEEADPATACENAVFLAVHGSAKECRDLVKTRLPEIALRNDENCGKELRRRLLADPDPENARSNRVYLALRGETPDCRGLARGMAKEPATVALIARKAELPEEAVAGEDGAFLPGAEAREKALEAFSRIRLTTHGDSRERFEAAQWLVRAVEQRERTLLRVARETVQAQTEFLAGRSDAPAPLMMQEIADRVGVDISTVCRAVREKYMDTPRGILPLRMLFTRAVGGAAGAEGKSKTHIKNRIRDLIEGEDKKSPLKDDQIQALLLKDGIDIKRRTVANYRNQLGYPSYTRRVEH